MDYRASFVETVASPCRDYEVYTFLWSDVEYTPKQLHELYSSRVPFLVMTTQGYLGRDEGINAVAADEIYWLREVAKQPRMVVKTEEEVYYSIPLDHPQRVIPITQDKSTDIESITFKELVNDMDYTEFLFTQDDESSTHSVFQGPDEYGDIDFGKLTIHEPYDEYYLVGHALMDNYVNRYACIIPLYMPITLTIAVGLSKEDYGEFCQLMLDMKTFVDSVPKEVAYPRELLETSEILMYDGKPADGEYTHLEPLTYVTLKNRNSKKDSKHLYMSLFQAAGEEDDDDNTHQPKSQKDNLREVAQHVGKTLERKQKAKKKRKNKKNGSTSIRSVLYEPDRGGIRGLQSTIAKMVKFGYHVSERHPIDVLDELKQVFLMEDTSNVKENSDIKMAIDLPEEKTCKKSDSPVNDVYRVGTEVDETEREQIKECQETKKDMTEQNSEYFGLSEEICTKKPLSSFSVEDVSEFLMTLQLHEHKKMFHENQVDGEVLIQMDEDDLRTKYLFSSDEAEVLMKGISSCVDVTHM